MAQYAASREEFRAGWLAGWADRVGSRQDILVVDVVRGFTDQRSPLAGDFGSQIETTNALLEVTRGRGAPVVFSTVAYDAELREAGLWIHKIPSNSWLVEGSEWVDMDERLGRRDT